jgi:hypothetical protein
MSNEKINKTAKNLFNAKAQRREEAKFFSGF